MFELWLQGEVKEPEMGGEKNLNLLRRNAEWVQQYLLGTQGEVVCKVQLISMGKPINKYHSILNNIVTETLLV